ELSKINHISFAPPNDFEAQADKLAGALQSNVEWLRRHTRFGDRARLWDEAGRPNGRRLLVGDEIKEAEAWIGSRPRSAPEPTSLHRAHLAASQKATARRQRFVV